MPLAQHGGRSPHRRDAGVTISAIDRDQRSQPHRLSQQRIVKQFLLGHHRGAPWNQRQHDGRIDVGDVVRHEHVSAFGIEPVQSDGLHPYSGQPRPHPGRPHRHAIEKTDIAGQKRPGKTKHRRQRKRQTPEREHQRWCGSWSGRSQRPGFAFQPRPPASPLLWSDFVQIGQLQLNFLAAAYLPMQCALAG